MKKKSDAPALIKAMVVEMQARSSNKMRRLRADGDGSYTSRDMKELLGDYQIFMEFSSPYDSQQNGAAENAVGLMEKDVKVSLVCSEAPPMMWGEAVGHHQVTRNHLRSRKTEAGDAVSPAYLLEKRQMEPGEFVPFGAVTVVAIAKKQRKEGKTITQKVGWTGACVGYGELTGHGGALRIYNPGKRAVKVVSRNLCTINVNAFYWKEKKKEGWTDTESPADWLLTPEALMDPEELEKYGLDEEILAELAVDFSSPDMQPQANPEARPDDTPGGVESKSNANAPAAAAEKEARERDEIPALEVDPDLPAPVVGGDADTTSSLAQEPKIDELRRSTRLRGGQQTKPKPTLKSKTLKENQGYIDGILGEEIVEGKEHVIVHWEGFAPGNDTSSMAKSYARRFPVLRGMLEDFEKNKVESGAPATEMGSTNSQEVYLGATGADGHSINAVVKRKLMSLNYFSINSSGNGRTRLLVPSRVNY
jgi:hypothetical protein